MGYDMNLKLTVTPPERYPEVRDALKEDFQMIFDEDNESWEQSGMVRWSDMTDDLVKFSRRFPDVWIQVLAEGEDGAMWCEYFRNGETTLDSRPDWNPPAVPGEKVYTVIFLYPDYASGNYGQETYLGIGKGSGPSSAIADALVRWNNERIADDENVSPYPEEDVFCIACIKGDHQDEKP